MSESESERNTKPRRIIATVQERKNENDSESEKRAGRLMREQWEEATRVSYIESNKRLWYPQDGVKAQSKA